MQIHVVRQFATMDSLQASGATDALRASVESSADGHVDERIVPGMQNWLDMATPSQRMMPTRFKMTVLMFVGMFPVSLGVHHLWKLFPEMMAWPTLLNAALMTLVVTIVTMNVAMPILMNVFSRWLGGGPGRSGC